MKADELVRPSEGNGWNLGPSTIAVCMFEVVANETQCADVKYLENLSYKRALPKATRKLLRLPEFPTTPFLQCKV